MRVRTTTEKKVWVSVTYVYNERYICPRSPRLSVESLRHEAFAIFYRA